MNSGNITIIEAESNFKKIDKSLIENDNIDCQTLGVYAKIVVLGKKWQLNIKGLSTHLNLSESKIRKSISLLEEEGYIKRTPVRNEKGQCLGWDYSVFPTSIPVEERSKAGKSNALTDYPENRVVGKPCCRETVLSENGGGIIYRLKETIDLNNKETKEEKEDTNVSSKDDENWRTSFAIYKSLVDEAKLRLINDRDYQAYIESYYPNADYVKTINKMVEGFWGIEDGWEHCKKKRKAKNINMYVAMKKNLDNRNRIVYNSISTFPSKKSYNPKNEENKPSVPLHPELTYVDNDGTLSDGTFMKNGYRYYFSNKQGESFSVPPGEEPKPSGDNWEYAYGTGWYENIE